eukprot:3540201-Amphidinium_carterae.1
MGRSHLLYLLREFGLKVDSRSLPKLTMTTITSSLSSSSSSPSSTGESKLELLLCKLCFMGYHQTVQTIGRWSVVRVYLLAPSTYVIDALACGDLTPRPNARPIVPTGIYKTRFIGIKTAELLAGIR